MTLSVAWRCSHTERSLIEVSWTIDQAAPSSRDRLYPARAVDQFVLDKHDQRLRVDLGWPGLRRLHITETVLSSKNMRYNYMVDIRGFLRPIWLCVTASTETFTLVRQNVADKLMEDVVAQDKRVQGVVMADRSGLIVYWDAGASNLFGIEAEAALGQQVDLIVPEDQRDKHWEGFTRVMQGGERHLAGATINLPVRVGSGEVLAFPAQFVHLADAHDSMVAVAAVFSARIGDESPWTPVGAADAND